MCTHITTPYAEKKTFRKNIHQMGWGGVRERPREYHNKDVFSALQKTQDKNKWMLSKHNCLVIRGWKEYELC